jgi:hypothetical protein
MPTHAPTMLATPPHTAELEHLGDEIAELSAHLDAATARPLLAEALGRGELSYSKVRALTRVATPETEARLLAVGRAGATCHVERIVRGWRRVDRLAEAREAKRRHAGRAFHIHQDKDGMVVIRGRLEPEIGALVMQALAAARETRYQKTRAAATDRASEPPTMAQQQADTLALIAETALHHELDPGPQGTATRW